MYINQEKFKKKLLKSLYQKDVFFITSGEEDHTWKECSCSLQDLPHTGHTSTDEFFLAPQILETIQFSYQHLHTCSHATGGAHACTSGRTRQAHNMHTRANWHIRSDLHFIRCTYMKNHLDHNFRSKNLLQTKPRCMQNIIAKYNHHVCCMDQLLTYINKKRSTHILHCTHTHTILLYVFFMN